ncbi:MAG: putative bifunctional diguanylate cyclase/phosphodiesterase [Thermosynechococcaceae cyanobacterium]
MWVSSFQNSLKTTISRSISTLAPFAGQAERLATTSPQNCQCHFLQAPQSEESIAQPQNDLAASFALALEQGEFKVHYQPQFDLETGQLTGAEALVRWLHPTQGMIAPGRFIAIAEETGFIIHLGEWVLRQACQQMKQWQQQTGSPLKIAVNLSARQLESHNLCTRIAQILSETGLSASSLELELTESSLIQDDDVAFSIMGHLKAMGLRLALDDFGTGYSSLKHLQRRIFDTIKIDRSFISNVNLNSVNAAITAAAIDLAHKLSSTVVGEGVETIAEQNFLLEHQCDLIQGYLTGYPVDGPNFLATHQGDLKFAQ